VQQVTASTAFARPEVEIAAVLLRQCAAQGGKQRRIVPWPEAGKGFIIR